MSIDKPSWVHKIWANLAATGAGGKSEPADALKDTGWTATDYCPTFEHVNWLLGMIQGIARYLAGRGVPDYDALESYDPGDRVQYTDGYTYKCIQANTPASAKNPTQAAYWERWGHSATDIQDIIDDRVDAAVPTTSGNDPSMSNLTRERFRDSSGNLLLQRVTFKLNDVPITGKSITLTNNAAFSTVIYSGQISIATGSDFEPCRVGLSLFDGATINDITAYVDADTPGGTAHVFITLIGK